MSNIIEKEDITTSLPRPQVKPTIPLEEVPEELRGAPLTSAQIKAISEAMLPHIQQMADNAKVQNGMSAQVIGKKNVPVIDWTKISQDDIYRPDINIEATPVMSGDPLKVELKDKNYEARWVNKKSERLGYMLSIGFTYVKPEDLQTNLAVEISPDASGHFSFHDVVLMRIPKKIYYGYLAANQKSAELRTAATQANKNGMVAAQEFMSKEAGSEFVDAARSSQMSFYTPGA